MMQKGSHLKKANTPGSAGKRQKSGTRKTISNANAKKAGGSSSKRNIAVKANGKSNTLKDDLTKKFLETAARKSMEEAAVETMKVMGYNVVAKNGWVVKVFPNKKVVRISPIPRVIEKK